MNSEVLRGLDPADVETIAHDAFLAAYASYNPSRGSFGTWMGVRFKTKLLNYHHARNRENARRVALDAPEVREALTYTSSCRDWSEFRLTLTTDARTVADLALSPTVPIIYATIERGGALHNLRAAIREALREMGWTSERIRMAVREILEAIRS